MKKCKIYYHILPFLLLLLTSCSFFNNASEYPEWEGWTNVPPGISITVDAPAVVSDADSLQYRVTFTNHFDQKISVSGGASMSNSFELDLAVINSKEQWIWARFPRDMVYIPRNGVLLEPGESAVMEDAWDLRDMHDNKIPTGTYKLIGGLDMVFITFWENGNIIKSENFSFEERPFGSEPLFIEVR